MRSSATPWDTGCACERAGDPAMSSAPMNSSRIGDPLRILLLRFGAGAENRLTQVVDERFGVTDARRIHQQRGNDREDCPYLHLSLVRISSSEMPPPRS